MSKPKTLPHNLEQEIRIAQAKLDRLSFAKDLISPATYDSSQRDILRQLVKDAIIDVMTDGISLQEFKNVTKP